MIQTTENADLDEVNTIMTDAPSGSGEQDRLTAFMTKHGLQTTTDLGQVFRVGQSTCARWIRVAQQLGSKASLEDVLQGPAFILFELMEKGLMTEDLLAMKTIVATRSNPDAITDLKWESSWSLTIPDYARQGLKITTKQGHFITVHSGWLKQRIHRLEADRDEQQVATDVQTLLKRYRSAQTKMAALPR